LWWLTEKIENFKNLVLIFQLFEALKDGRKIFLLPEALKIKKHKIVIEC